MCRRNLSASDKRHFLIQMLKIGCVGFGGGTALIPLLHKGTVNKYVDEDYFNEAVSVANITPGALPVEIACGVGYQVMGRYGMLLASILISLPGFVATLLLLLIFDLNNFKWFTTFSILANIYVCYNLIKYVARTKWSKTSIIITSLIFVSTFGKSFGLPYIPTLYIFIGIFIIQIIGTDNLKKSLRPSVLLIKDICIIILPMIVLILLCTQLYTQTLNYVKNGILSTIFSFGGGDSYLSSAYSIFQKELTEHEFYNLIVPLVNVLPGSILCKTLPAIGFVIGEKQNLSTGIALAFLGYYSGVAISCLVFRVVETISKKLKSSDLIRPATNGLLLSICVQILRNMLISITNI